MSPYATILFLLLTVPAYAVEPYTPIRPDPVLEPWRWTTFDQTSGLAGGVRDLYEDREGNIWIATNQGAQKYDGYRWTTYTTEDGLGHDQVRSILQDREGAMWFRTIDGGVSRFAPGSGLPLQDRGRGPGQAPGSEPGQIAWTTWTETDGLPANAAKYGALAQSRDGSIWLGAEDISDTEGVRSGLARFDGETWERVDIPVGPPRPPVGSLLVSSDGSLWVGTQYHGILRYDPSMATGEAGWTRYDQLEGAPIAWVTGVTEGRDGSLWFACFDNRVRRILRLAPGISSKGAGRVWHSYTTEDGLPDGRFSKTWQALDGSVWTKGSSKSLSRFDGTRWETYDLPRKTGNRCSSTRDGAFWFFGLGGDRIDRLDYASTRWRTFEFGEEIFGWAADRDGNLWLGTQDGALRYDGTTWLKFGPEDGLLAAGVNGISLAKDGAVWFLAASPHRFEGATRYENGTWQQHSQDQIGLDQISLKQRDRGKQLFSGIEAGTDGTVWLAGGKEGTAAAARYDGSSWRLYTREDGLVGESLGHATLDQNGNIWFSVWSDSDTEGSGLLRFDGDRWTSYTTADGLLNNKVSDIFPHPDGTLWVGVFGGLSRFVPSGPGDRTWQSTTAQDGLPGSRPRGFTGYRGDVLWSYNAPSVGISRSRGEKWRTYTRGDGLAGVYQTFVDADSTLWGYGGGASALDGPYAGVNYTAESGFPGGWMVDMIQTRDGTIWFRTDQGRIGGFVPDRVPPKTEIVEAPSEVSSVGNILVRWSGGDRLEQTARKDLRYRYRLDGGEWGPIANRTDVTFTALAPGSHEFEVQARDLDGNLDATPAVHAFVVEVVWWRNPVVAGPGVLIIAFALFQSARVVQRDKRLREGNQALSDANKELFQVNVDLQREQVLERLRGQAQGMQSSEDIGLLVEAVYRELDGLGLPVISSAITVQLPDGKKENWETAEDGRALEPFINQGSVGGPRGPGNDYYNHRHLEGVEVQKALRDVVAKDHPRWKGIPEERWPQKTDNYTVFFDGGSVWVASEEPIVEECLMLIKRFGEVFGFAHSRYKELQEKEAQNRHLAVEASVQHLRAEVQSMDEASDFERILSQLTESLKTVELTFEGCGIDVLDEPVEHPSMEYFEKVGFRYTAYRMDPQGTVTAKSYPVPAPFPDVIEQTIERFIAGEPWQALIEGQAIVEVPAGAYGRLRLTASERDRFTDDEVATLREFADAVALGYARYLDIREIQQQTERKSAFLASMSHELRTPMNAIKGFTDFVLRRDKSMEDGSRENLQKVTQASDHLLAMINDLLDLSKIEAGRMVVSPVRFDVGELVTSACDTVSPLVQEGVELRQDVSDDIGAAHTDKARLQQMVINLLSNAIKFTDTGNVTVSASQADGQLVIAVSDTGKGIPADELPTIFDEYRQAEGSESSVQKGTGLGLSITKKFAELLGGTIGVESEVGKGSTFTVRVPTSYQPPEA